MTTRWVRCEAGYWSLASIDDRPSSMLMEEVISSIARAKTSRRSLVCDGDFIGTEKAYFQTKKAYSETIEGFHTERD